MSPMISCLRSMRKSERFWESSWDKIASLWKIGAKRIFSFGVKAGLLNEVDGRSGVELALKLDRSKLDIQGKDS